MIRLSYYLVLLLFAIAFFQGLLSTYGIQEPISRLAMNGIVLLIFFISIFYMFQKRKVNLIGFFPLVLILVFMMISFYLSATSLLHLIFFIKIFILPFLFFMALFNIPFSENERKNILKFLIFLILIQIPAAIVKTLIMGFTERYIGTVGIHGGSLASIIPLMAISYVFAYYMYNSDNKKVLLLIPMLIFISMSCSKLGVIIYLSILLIALYFMNEKNKLFTLKTLLSLVVFLMVVFVTVYAFISITPRANPDGVVGGEVDFEYAIKFAETYTSRKNKETRLVGVARKDAPKAVYTIMENKNGIMTLLFGLGPGELVVSSYLPYENPLRDKYRLGYGARLGFLWTTMQIGIIGSVLYLSFHILLFRRIYHKYKMSRSKEHKVLFLGTIGLSFIFLLDYFTYSNSLTIQPSTVFLYFYLFFFVLKLDNDKI